MKRGGLQLCNGVGSARKTYPTTGEGLEILSETRRQLEKLRRQHGGWLGAERRYRDHTETSEKDASRQENEAKTHTTTRETEGTLETKSKTRAKADERG